MKIGGIPNKFEIFQDFYYDENGVEISYQEALKLYSQMDADTKTDFEKYYKDETGYEIISRTGYNFERVPFTVKDTGKTKKVKRKEKQADGSIKYVEKEGKVLITTKTITLPDGTTKTIENYTPQSTLSAIRSKYELEAYMKKNGMILDPQWANYSAEEILQMANDGVNIPQEIIDAANSIYQSSGANFEVADEGADTATSDETTEKEPFLDLIPKAEKKIKKCNENSEKIEDKVEDLLPEQQKKQKSFEKQMEAQRRSLKEFEESIREWRVLQNKVNNGEALSDSEARRYAEITGMLEDKNNSDNSSLDKREIARNLNDINILAALGEKLANETIEIGETLADYTSKTNYKTTRKEVRGQIGFLAAIIAMARGERLAVESVKIGNDTKEYTEETQKSVSEIASLMEIEGSIASTDNLKTDKEEQQTPQEQKETAAVTQDAQTPASELPADTVENENEENPTAEAQAKTSEVTMEEDFIVNDDNVLDLIGEAGDITGDLLEQTGKAVKTVISAKEDSAFAKNASKKIAKIVKEYQEEEARRQQEIETLENENKESYKKLEELTGKDKADLEKEITGEEKESDNTISAAGEKDSAAKDNPKTKESDKQEIEERKTSIKANNAKIAELNVDTESQIEDFKARTTNEKSRIQKSIPEENELLENNTKYAEEIIPQDKERLDFTDNSGETLAKMGKYRIIVGIEQIMTYQYRKGIKNVAKGTISAGIGLGAMIISRTPVPKITEKATNKAVKEGTKAITGLNQVDGQISAITGEETSQSQYDTQKAESQEAQTQPEASTEEMANAQTTESAQTEESTQAGETPAQTAETQDSTEQTLVDTNIAASVEDMQKAPANTDNTEATTEETENTVSTVENTPSSSKKEKEVLTTDKAQENVDKTADSAKDDSKDSENIKKDTDKTTKELEKETKHLKKQMKKDEKDIIKMTKESTKAAKKQIQILKEFEEISLESEQLMAEDQAAQQSQPAQPVQPAKNEEQGGLLANNSFSNGNAQSSDNTDKLNENDTRLNVLSADFQIQGRKIDRNRTKILKIQKSTKKTDKKFRKKVKTIDKINKENEKHEIDKQKKLAKQLGAVGIAENLFNLTLATGLVLSAIPGCQGVGATMIKIGTWGIIRCGITKGLINIANGNLQAGLMSIGMAAITAATAGTVPTGSVLSAVAGGLTVVSTSAELVNNVRAVQGKEANGTFGKISAIAGMAAAGANIANSFSSSTKILEDGTETVVGFKALNTLGKVATIGTAVGSAMSSTSQVMTEFGNSNSKLAQTLGTVGGALSLASSAYLVASAFNGNSKNDEQNNDSNSNDSTKTNETGKNNEQTDANKQADKAAKQQQKELKKAEAEAKKAQQKQELQDAKDAKASQKEQAKDITDKRQRDNMVKDGASKEFADIDDATIGDRYDYAIEIGDEKLANNLQNEMNRRQEYQTKMSKLSAHNSQKMDKIKGVANTLGKGMEVTSSFMKGNESQAQTKKKKGFAAGTLSEEAKKRLRKDKKRIATLSSSYRNRRYN